jgi:hypothetical protein
VGANVLERFRHNRRARVPAGAVAWTQLPASAKLYRQDPFERSRVDPSTPSASAPRPNRLLIVTAAIALVVGLVIGAVIGWQLEKRRVEDDVDRLRDKIEDLSGRSLGTPPSADDVTIDAVVASLPGDVAERSIDYRLVISPSPLVNV